MQPYCQANPYLLQDQYAGVHLTIFTSTIFQTHYPKGFFPRTIMCYRFGASLDLTNKKYTAESVILKAYVSSRTENLEKKYTLVDETGGL